ncbi:odorant receptor 23a-like isoform X2 [Lycorma delicatula]|uniref:odorant receptor 23a-like isoform X2 n=1 Tax=Lycorma delicatula TaxID=130591 RepID=UPI003F5192F0
MDMFVTCEFMLCLCSFQIYQTSNLHQSVYFCNWFDESQPFKTSLSIIQCRTNRPFIILAGKTVPVTLKSFIKCLQAAFSYFNLLRALSHT